MSCQLCGTEYTNLDLCNTCKELTWLREQVTTLKAERDEAVHTRDEVHHELAELLARIHRDGGHYVDQHGFAKAVEDAHELVVQAHVVADRRDDDRLAFAKATIAKLSDLAVCYLTCEVDPTEERVAEIEALRAVGEMP